MRWYVLMLAAAAFAAQVLPTESGDVFYFAYGGAAGAVNVYGRALWTAPGQLVATDAMGSCLAVAAALYNETAFLGTQISLYAPDGRLLWSAAVKINATALATDCVRVAVGGLDGSLITLKDGRVERAERLDKPVFALAYKPDGSLAVGTGDPIAGFTAYVDRCGNSITAVKTDAPYLIVRPAGLRLRGGLAPMLKIPAAASQDCRTFVYAAYDVLYNGTEPLARLPLPVLAVAVSGDGRTVAAATAERLYVIRGGRVAAELELGSVPRSIALSWDGLSLAYATDAGIAVQRFKTVRIEARGCPLGVRVRVGNFTYAPPTEAYVPAEADALYAEVAEGETLRCVPLRNATALAPVTTVEYRVEHRITAPPLVEGPRWASGPAAFYAEPKLRVPADPPLGEVILTLAGWEVNGTRLGFPQPSLALDVRGPTRIRPVYRLEHPPEIVVGDIKYVVKSVTLFSKAGVPMADVDDAPAYARVQYEVFRLLAWDVPGNSSSMWLKEGETAVLRAPELVDFGNGTRLVLTRWSTGEEAAAITAGPGRYSALYDVYHRVAFTAANFTRVEWVKHGVKISPPPVGKVFDDGSARIYVAGWTAPDGEAAEFPHTVTMPVNFTAVERREFWVTIIMWDRREEGWYPEGYELPEPEQRKWLLWQFERWDPSPVVDAPGEYVAVYRLDPLALSLAVLVAATAAAAAWFYRRR